MNISEKISNIGDIFQNKMKTPPQDTTPRLTECKLRVWRERSGLNVGKGHGNGLTGYI